MGTIVDFSSVCGGRESYELPSMHSMHVAFIERASRSSCDGFSGNSGNEIVSSTDDEDRRRNTQTKEACDGKCTTAMGCICPAAGVEDRFWLQSDGAPGYCKRS